MTTTKAPCAPRLTSVSPTQLPAAERHRSLVGMVDRPWLLRVGQTNLLIRPCTARDLAAVARLHVRCSPQSLLDRFRSGGRGPSVAAIEQTLRRPLGYVACTPRGDIRAMAVATPDASHGPESAEIGLLVEDAWQGLGIGRELAVHLAGAALVSGYTELIAYTATSVTPAQRLMVNIGHTRVVVDPMNAHLHTYLPEAAALGLGAVREQLAS